MNITIRMGAAYHDMEIVEGEKVTAFDFTTMDKSDRHTVRRMLVGALANAGILDDKGGKFAVGRKANARRRRNRRRAAR